LSSKILAQINSVPSIARPRGITMMAGPGKTIMAIPISRTVKPITIITSLFACLMLLIKNVVILNLQKVTFPDYVIKNNFEEPGFFRRVTSEDV
jgi:hypothetical protein